MGVPYPSFAGLVLMLYLSLRKFRKGVSPYVVTVICILSVQYVFDYGVT